MSTKKLSTTKQGFTIIEVVLVLAIAGLIFLMVFVALPALQRSQRDTQRRDDVGRLVTAVTTYKANTGNMPSGGDQLNNYVDKANGGFKDPGNSSDYTIQVVSNDDNIPAESDLQLGTMYVILKSKCNASTPTHTDVSGDGYFSVYTKVENGGSICQDNS